MHLFLSNFIGPGHQTNVLTFTNSNLSNQRVTDGRGPTTTTKMF